MRLATFQSNFHWLTDSSIDRQTVSSKNSAYNYFVRARYEKRFCL